MKRTLLTGLFILATAAIVSQAMRWESQAIADKPSLAEQYPQPSNPFATIATPFTPTAKKTRTENVTVYVPKVIEEKIVYVREYREVAVEVSETEQRSQEYSDLMLQKAQRMTEGELDEAIDEVKAEIEAQDEAARTELQQAIDILEQIVETSAGTPAANRAQFALQVLKVPAPEHANSSLPVYGP